MQTEPDRANGTAAASDSDNMLAAIDPGALRRIRMASASRPHRWRQSLIGSLVIGRDGRACLVPQVCDIEHPLPSVVAANSINHDAANDDDPPPA